MPKCVGVGVGVWMKWIWMWVRENKMQIYDFNPMVAVWYVPRLKNPKSHQSHSCDIFIAHCVSIRFSNLYFHLENRMPICSESRKHSIQLDWNGNDECVNVVAFNFKCILKMSCILLPKQFGKHRISKGFICTQFKYVLWKFGIFCVSSSNLKERCRQLTCDLPPYSSLVSVWIWGYVR